MWTFGQTFFHESPASVDLLGATFDFEALTTGKLMSLELDEVGLGPCPLAVFLHSLLLMDD